MLKLPMKHLACLIYCFFVIAPLSAQDITKQGTLFNWAGSDAVGGPASMSEGLIGDRPDFIEASRTVGRGVKQVEMGYTYFFDNDGTTQTRRHSSPEMLWRLGFYADWLEMRIGYNFSESRERTGGVDTSTRGGEDLYLGFKIALTPQDGALPETALMLQATVPTGDDSVTAGETLPAITYIYAWELNEKWSLAGQTQVGRAIDGTTGRPYAEFSQAAGLVRDFDDQLVGYFEWFCMIPDGADDAPREHYMDGGFAYQVHKNLQFDVRVGFGVSDSADDYFAGLGLIYRY
jgi:hypothetical protein